MRFLLSYSNSADYHGQIDFDSDPTHTGCRIGWLSAELALILICCTKLPLAADK